MISKEVINWGEKKDGIQMKIIGTNNVEAMI